LGEKTNWLHSDDLAMLYRGPFIQDFYRELHHRVHHEFRARKAWHKVTDLLSQPGQARPQHLRQAISIPLNLARLLKSSTRLKKLAQVSHDSLSLELQQSL
jgi:hypothetical protein